MLKATAAPSIGRVPRSRTEVMSKARHISATAALVYGSVAVFALVMAGVAIHEHLMFVSPRLDLGNMTQAVWSTAHGHFLEMTDVDGRQFTRLGVHVDPFLALLAPLWWLWPSPLLLLTLQALAVPVGAVPLFWLARKHLNSERVAAVFVVLYLAFPVTQWSAYTPDTGFHPVTLSIPLLLFALWFLDEDRLAWFALFALLAATTKEQMPLVVGLLGIWYAVSRRRVRVGAAIFASGLIATVASFVVVMPLFRPDGEELYSTGLMNERFASLGGTPGALLHGAIVDPAAVIDAVATSQNLFYLILVLIPLLALWARAPLLMLAIAPELALNLLWQRDEFVPGFFHSAAMVPALFGASVLGAARLGDAARRRALFACVVVVMLEGIALSPLRVYWDVRSGGWASERLLDAKEGALGLIPPGVAVSASDRLGSHLSERRRVMVFPFIAPDVRWVVVDAHDSRPRDAKRERERLRSLERDPQWRAVYSSSGVMVFRRSEPVGGTSTLEGARVGADSRADSWGSP
jgi:uncharacterized membrane protein